ncbi:UDP-N-acetylmuramoyl-tripeptide--D-alanyl-D-alanine ligase [Olivibacter sitiensis]|uniref:UDP-N-acetylmuramoyl-tripeptide--D-alanyl-D- alanine ligase n=1 Tax=Olivibacter sitiensis TaxID=376470 RepID=UPI0004297D09|nr:UDP-N-acetylmuramoyl-tripeptide--D-alanyl-D-alanine ligase [Olivibacter sitiensis]
MDIQSIYRIFQEHPTICTDTRKISPDSLFFALKGANFNGNAFADKALEAGAAYAVIDEEKYAINERFILVNDVLQCLQQLATWHRRQLTIPFIGITGTNGKTTTKELIYAVLSQHYNAQATQGNLNNHIGVPLTLLSIKPETEIAIIEMGANHVGEIAFLCQIAQPTHGLITNVGKAHLEGFGSFEGVKKAKGELYDWLAAHQGCLFLQQDNAHLRGMAQSRSFAEIVTYGTATENDLYGQLIQAQPTLHLEWAEKTNPNRYHAVESQLTGAYNLENILAAISIGRKLGLSVSEINAGIQKYVPSNNRSQLLKTDNNTVICDYYNANASSMAAAIANFDIQQADKKTLVLGDMFELGDASYDEHEHVIAQAKQLKNSKRHYVGHAFYEQREKDQQALFFEDTAHLKTYLAEHPVIDSLVLLKASRGMAFEQVVPFL